MSASRAAPPMAGQSLMQWSMGQIIAEQALFAIHSGQAGG